MKMYSMLSVVVVACVLFLCSCDVMREEVKSTGPEVGHIPAFMAVVMAGKTLDHKKDTFSKGDVVVIKIPDEDGKEYHPILANKDYRYAMIEEITESAEWGKDRRPVHVLTYWIRFKPKTELSGKNVFEWRNEGGLATYRSHQIGKIEKKDKEQK